MPRTESSRSRLVFLAFALTACARPVPVPAPVAPPVAVARLAASPDMFIDRDGLRFRYREIGSGSPVILLHGATRTLRDWDGIADSLARTHRVIAFDQRGHGQSTKSGDTKSYGWTMVDDLVRVLDHLRIEKAHLVGHSLGAVVASGAVLRHPTRVASATFIGGPFMPDSATYASGLSPYVSELERGEGFVNFFKFVLPGLPDSTARLMSTQSIAANDMPSVIAVLKSMAAMIVPPATSGGVPVLFAVGDGDPFVQLSVAAAQRVPGAKLVKPVNADHFTIMVHPTLLPAMRQLMQPGAR